jgi:hypothetical protein
MNAKALETPAPEYIETYDQLRDALNHRRVELGLTMLEVDERAGLSSGHASKLLVPPSKQMSLCYRNIGPVSLPLVLGALKVRIRLEPID